MIAVKNMNQFGYNKVYDSKVFVSLIEKYWHIFGEHKCIHIAKFYSICRSLLSLGCHYRLIHQMVPFQTIHFTQNLIWQKISTFSSFVSFPSFSFFGSNLATQSL